jgi:hypothetical protein
MISEDRDKLISLLADEAFNSNLNSNEYFRGLLRESGIPKLMTFEAVPLLDENPEVAARDLVNWAWSKGKNPQNPNHKVLGNLLLPLLKRLGLENFEFLAKISERYDLLPPAVFYDRSESEETRAILDSIFKPQISRQSLEGGLGTEAPLKKGLIGDNYPRSSVSNKSSKQDFQRRKIFVIPALSVAAIMLAVVFIVKTYSNSPKVENPSIVNPPININPNDSLNDQPITDEMLPDLTVQEALSVAQSYLDAKNTFFARDYSADSAYYLMNELLTNGGPQQKEINNSIWNKQQVGEYTKYYEQEIEEYRNFSFVKGKGKIELKIREKYARCSTNTDEPIRASYPRQDTTWYGFDISYENGRWKLNDIETIESLNELDRTRMNDPSYNIQFCSDMI